MSARAFLIALAALAAGCAGRALPQQGAAVPPPQVPGVGVQSAAGAPPPEAEARPLAEYGAHGPPAFPEIRGSSAAFATYSTLPPQDTLEDPDPPAPDGAAPGPSPLIVQVPEGVTPLPPFDPPAPAILPPPPFRPPPPSPTRRWAPSPLPPPRVTVVLPGGEVCLKKLALLGVDFQKLDEIRGIETPVQIQSAIGGVRYHSGFGPMVSDCRFALALATAAPELTALGVSEMQFSGAYSYRTSRVGRLSLHAYGLALDVHEIVVGDRRLNVERDFARGIGCGVGPALNRVACKLRELGLFRELLTPDYNADHNNHFHLGIAPLGPLANELWAKRPVRHPSPQLPVFGNASRTIRASSDATGSAPEKRSKESRLTKQKAPARSRAKSGNAEATDEREGRKRPDSAPAAKSKSEQAANEGGRKKARNEGAERERKSPEQERERPEQERKRAKQERKGAERERADRPERDEKRDAKARSGKRAPTPAKRAKHDRVKAAKRSNLPEKDGAS